MGSQQPASSFEAPGQRHTSWDGRSGIAAYASPHPSTTGQFSSILAGEVPPEEPHIVVQKAQAATKILAEMIAFKYEKDRLAGNGYNGETLERRAQLAQRALADAIATKYRMRTTTDTTVVGETVYTQYAAAAQRRSVQATSSEASQVYVSPAVFRGSHLVSESRGPPVITTNVVGQHWRLSGTAAVDIVSEQSVVQQSIVPRAFEVTIERPVVREIIVEKPYDVFVQRPVENRIETDVVYEKYIDNPVERVIETEVERVVSRAVECVVEKPVYVERVVERPVENVVERFVDVIVDRPVEVERTVDINVNRTVLRPYRNEVHVRESVMDVPIVEEVWVDRPYERVYERVVEVPVEVQVSKEVVREVERPVYQDVIVEKRVNVDREIVVDVPEIKRVKRSIVVDQVVDRPYEVVREVPKPIRRTVQRVVDREVVIDRVVDVPVVREVEVPVYIDRQVEVPVDVEVDREVVIDRYIDVEVEEIQEVPVHVVRQVDVPVEKRVTKYVEVPREQYQDVEEIQEVVVQVDRVVERRVRVDKIVPRTVEVERIVEVPVERTVPREIVVDKVVERPVYIEKIVEKPVERVVERRVERPVERFIEVPHEVVRDRIIEVETVVDKPVYRDVYNEQESHTIVNNKNEKLRRELTTNLETQATLQAEIDEWRWRVESVRAQQSAVEGVGQVLEQTVGYNENRELRVHLDNLHEEYDNAVDQKNFHYTQQFSQKPRVSGYGQRRLVGHGQVRVSQIMESRTALSNSNEFGTYSPARPQVSAMKPTQARTSSMDHGANSFVIQNGVADSSVRRNASYNVYTTQQSSATSQATVVRDRSSSRGVEGYDKLAAYTLQGQNDQARAYRPVAQQTETWSN